MAEGLDGGVAPDIDSGTDPDYVDEGFQTGTEGQFDAPAGGVE